MFRLSMMMASGGVRETVGEMSVLRMAFRQTTSQKKVKGSKSGTKQSDKTAATAVKTYLEKEFDPEARETNLRYSNSFVVSFSFFLFFFRRRKICFVGVFWAFFFLSRNFFFIAIHEFFYHSQSVTFYGNS